MGELKDLTALQLVSMIQELSTIAIGSDGLTTPTRARKYGIKLIDINDIAEVLKNKLEVQAWKNAMGVSK